MIKEREDQRDFLIMLKAEQPQSRRKEFPSINLYRAGMLSITQKKTTK
jgi:hypothetical protein